MTYSDAFKAEMVQKLTAPGAPSATALAQEIGVPQTTLSKWVRQTGRVTAMTKKRTPSVKRPQDWTAEEKMTVVVEAAQVPEEELGGLLRRRGLHRSDLERWRRQILTGLSSPTSSPKSSPEARRVRELERQVSRKEKALAEAAALLILQKKAQALWGDEDDATTRRSGQ